MSAISICAWEEGRMCGPGPCYDLEMIWSCWEEKDSPRRRKAWQHKYQKDKHFLHLSFSAPGRAQAARPCFCSGRLMLSLCLHCAHNLLWTTCTRSPAILPPHRPPLLQAGRYPEPMHMAASGPIPSSLLKPGFMMGLPLYQAAFFLGNSFLCLFS